MSRRHEPQHPPQPGLFGNTAADIIGRKASEQDKSPDRATDAPEAPKVRCRQCRHSSDFSGTTPDCCYCAALHRRVCACDRYGRRCGNYELKVEN